MAEGKPLWWRGLDRVDRVLAPAVEGVVGHEAFSLGYAVVIRGRRGIAHRAERLSRQVLHALNLPAGSDVNRLLAQIASVEREVRELGKAIEDHGGTPRGNQRADH